MSEGSLGEEREGKVVECSSGKALIGQFWDITVIFNTFEACLRINIWFWKMSQFRQRKNI